MEYYILTIDPNFCSAMHWIGHKKDRADGYFKTYRRMGHVYIVLFEVDRINDRIKPLATYSDPGGKITGEEIRDFPIKEESEMI